MKAGLKIEEERCVHRLCVLAHCRACVQVCPRSAWTVDAEGLAFDDVLCDGCGLCAAACPTGAIQAPLPWPAAHLARDGVRIVRLRCEKLVGATAECSPLPCIHAVDESQLLRWHQEGVSQLIAHTGACGSCTRRPSKGLGERLQQVNEALRLRGQRAMRLALDGGPHAAPAAAAKTGPHATPVADTAWQPAAAAPAERVEPPLNQGRRGLLGLLTRSQTAAPPAKPLSTPEPVPRCEATRLLARWGPGPVLWAVTFEARRCDACGACATLCPTRAIETVRAAATASEVLAFNMSRCIGCDVCVDACAPGALAPSAPLQVIGHRQAWSLVVGPCPRCGKTHRVLQAAIKARDDQLCPACRSHAARRSDRVVQSACVTRSHAASDRSAWSSALPEVLLPSGPADQAPANDVGGAPKGPRGGAALRP